MPATRANYLRRNEEIGCVAVYDISSVRLELARLIVNGAEVADGTVARVTDAHDFDFAYTYELTDGRRTRGGGNGWHHYRTLREALEWHGTLDVQPCRDCGAWLAYDPDVDYCRSCIAINTGAAA